MKEIADYRADMLTILGDASGRRYSESILDMGLREALSEYRGFCPRKETVRQKVLAVENGNAAVSWLFGPESELLLLRWNGKVLNLSGYSENGKLYLSLFPGGAGLREGDLLEMTVGVPHTVKGLDDAANTTVPDAHAMTICTGAAGYAMRIRARSVTEVFGKRLEDREALNSQANIFLREFRAALQQTALLASYQQEPWK